jgi:hypothetical protein
MLQQLQATIENGDVARCGMFIDGVRQIRADREKIPVESPVDERVVATVPDGTTADAVPASERPKRRNRNGHLSRHPNVRDSFRSWLTRCMRTATLWLESSPSEPRACQY